MKLNTVVYKQNGAIPWVRALAFSGALVGLFFVYAGYKNFDDHNSRQMILGGVVEVLICLGLILMLKRIEMEIILKEDGVLKKSFSFGKEKEIIFIPYSEITAVDQGDFVADITLHLISGATIWITQTVSRVEGEVSEEWPEAPNRGPVSPPLKDAYLMRYEIMRRSGLPIR